MREQTSLVIILYSYESSDSYEYSKLVVILPNLCLEDTIVLLISDCICIISLNLYYESKSNSIYVNWDPNLKNID